MSLSLDLNVLLSCAVGWGRGEVTPVQRKGNNRADHTVGRQGGRGEGRVTPSRERETIGQITLLGGKGGGEGNPVQRKGNNRADHTVGRQGGKVTPSRERETIGQITLLGGRGGR